MGRHHGAQLGLISGQWRSVGVLPLEQVDAAIPVDSLEQVDAAVPVDSLKQVDAAVHPLLYFVIIIIITLAYTILTKSIMMLIHTLLFCILLCDFGSTLVPNKLKLSINPPSFQTIVFCLREQTVVFQNGEWYAMVGHQTDVLDAIIWMLGQAACKTRYRWCRALKCSLFGSNWEKNQF